MSCIVSCLHTGPHFGSAQVFTLIAMEPPIRVSGTGSADYVRDAKVQPLQTVGRHSRDVFAFDHF